jgi:serine/threonine protein kinase
LCDRYELHDEIGKGAHGRIYNATDLVTFDKVAIKLMEKSTKNKSKFHREISLMKDMMKLAKKRPLSDNLITYENADKVL